MTNAPFWGKFSILPMLAGALLLAACGESEPNFNDDDTAVDCNEHPEDDSCQKHTNGGDNKNDDKQNDDNKKDEDACTTREECASDEICEDGACVPDPEADQTGECTTREECATDEICEDGACVPEPPALGEFGDPCDSNDACIEGLECHNGYCPTEEIANTCEELNDALGSTFPIPEEQCACVLGACDAVCEDAGDGLDASCVTCITQHLSVCGENGGEDPKDVTCTNNDECDDGLICVAGLCGSEDALAMCDEISDVSQGLITEAECACVMGQCADVCDRDDPDSLNDPACNSCILSSVSLCVTWGDGGDDHGPGSACIDTSECEGADLQCIHGVCATMDASEACQDVPQEFHNACVCVMAECSEVCDAQDIQDALEDPGSVDLGSPCGQCAMGQFMCMM